MQIILTGTPGTGKTTLAKALARKLSYKYLNERDFCEQKKIGRTDRKTKEIIVPINSLQMAVCKLFEKDKNIVIEGHLLCETKLKADLVVVLTCKQQVLEKRLQARKYSAEKVLDNLFCETENYCLNFAKKNFPAERLLVVDNSDGIKKSLPLIIRTVNGIGKQIGGLK